MRRLAEGRGVAHPGPENVAGRCDGCGGYFNPHELAKLRPAARKEAYGGICHNCAP